MVDPGPFVSVARIITKGEPPPEWIVRALVHFSPGLRRPGPIKISRAQLQRIVKEMRVAIDILEKYLPAFQNLPFDIRCPDEVAVVLDALPSVQRHLERINTEPRPGSPPDTRRPICAAVIVEIWKLVHGKAEPRSLHLHEACNVYSLACGGEEIGAENDPENWRRAAERAAAGDNEWIRSVLLAVQNQA